MPLRDLPFAPPPPIVTTPQHFVPPGKRELRAQSVHRLQFGLFGLCGMLLLVGLANIIMNHARLADTAQLPETAVAGSTKTKASDPLADIGVVPASDPSAAAAGAGTKTP
jgi:hypothetical protein